MTIKKDIFNEKEDLVFYNGDYFIGSEILPVRAHQALDELIQFQKEFTSEIYITRIREKYL